jgi:hypothetical protein
MPLTLAIMWLARRYPITWPACGSGARAFIP